MLSNTPPLAISGFITIAVGFFVLIWGIWAAKQKKYNQHKRVMQLAIIVLAAFLVQYIVRSSLEHKITHYHGPDFWRLYVFYPILTIHITFAIITIGLIVRHVLQARKNEQHTEAGAVYFPKEYRPNHHRLGTITYRLWLISYLGGIIVFIMLYVL